MSELAAQLLEVVVRPAEAGELGYVIDSWGRSLRLEYPDVRTRDFVGALRDGIGRRLTAGARLLVATPADESVLIIGWACISDAGILHYVYVRHAYRRLGIARRLLLSCTLPLVVDSMTADGRAIKFNHPETIRYIPAI
jgi:GNAT superfamily N-acetyltransferase